jgi:hypothetical protein
LYSPDSGTCKQAGPGGPSLICLLVEARGARFICFIV